MKAEAEAAAAAAENAQRVAREAAVCGCSGRSVALRLSHRALFKYVPCHLSDDASHGPKCIQLQTSSIIPHICDHCSPRWTHCGKHARTRVVIQLKRHGSCRRKQSSSGCAR